MGAAFRAVTLIAATATALAQAPGRTTGQSHDRALSALEGVRSAVEANDYARFSDLLTKATAVISDPALVGVVHTYEDLRAVWQYSLTNPIGAFFDDQSSNGLFSRLVDRYPEYRQFIEQFAIHAAGRTLYPTAETRNFLARRAAARLREEGAPAVAPPTPKPVPPPPQPSPVGPTEVCPATVAIQSIVPSARGLLIRSSGPITGTLVKGPQTSEEIVSALPTLTIDLPNAALVGVPARAEWPTGPLQAMRATRYRTEEACGIRLRLEPRVAANWRLIPVPNGISLTLETLEAAAVERVVAAPPRQAGTLSISSSLSGSRDSRPDTPSTASGFVAIGFAQSLPPGGTLRAFFSQVKPTAVGSPFGAIGVVGVPAGDLALDAALGDIVVDLGDTGDGELASITSSLFRGVGFGARRSEGMSLQLFGGRAASPSLLRVGADSTYAPAAHDRIVGGQASWVPLESDYAAAAGALHTASPGGGLRTLNLFQAVEYRRTPVLRIRLVTEESRAFDAHTNGFAYTLQSRVLARTLTLDGYYRALSARFRPAGGSGFYASLRRSYGLAASYRRELFSISASSSQAKVFNIFDPENVGSLTSTIDASVAYAISRHLSLQGSYGEFRIRSDPGAKIPADSHTRQTGAGFGLAAGKIQASTQLVHSATENKVDPSLDLVSQRIDVAFTSSYGRDIYGRLSIGHSERRNGSFAGSDYRVALGAPLFEFQGLRVSAEAGSDVRPAGVTQTAFRQTYGTVRVSPTRSTWLSGSLQLTYEHVTTDLEKFNVFFASVNTQQLVRWGEGFLVPQYETRALRLAERRVARPTSATVHVMVFEDQNQNGALDPGEPPVAPAFVEIAGRRYRTNAKGEVAVQIPPGKQVVQLLPRGAVIGYFVPTVTVHVEAAAGETAQASFALRPAGRVVGTIEAQGEIEPGLLAGLIIRAVGPIDRQSFTDSSGVFDFGLLPEGIYRVELVAEPLRDHGLAAVAPAQITARVTRGQRQSLALRVRKLTARERFKT